jgi:hypothetical protein
MYSSNYTSCNNFKDMGELKQMANNRNKEKREFNKIYGWKINFSDWETFLEELTKPVTC